MSILTLEGVEKSYFGRKILEQVSLRLERGDKLALIGDNGAGKSTLFRLISGGEQLDSGTIRLASGTVAAVLGQQLEEASSDTETPLDNPRLEAAEMRMRELEHDISLARDQAAGDSLLRAYSRAQAEFESLGGYDYRHRAAQILAGLEFKGDRLNQPLISLSGGERMRVQMARILVGRPDLLMLDEPTNHLDIAGIEWLEDYIQRFGGTVLFISHDRSFINRCADRVAELNAGRLTIYSGNYSAYLAQKEIEQDYARQEVKRLEQEVKREEDVVQTMLSHRAFGAYHSREKKVIRLSQELEEARQKVAVGPGRMNFHFVPQELSGDPDRFILEARNLEKSYGQRCLFSDVSFSLRAREHFVLAGPNGCGKTTLLNLLRGLDTDFGGEVKLASGIRFAAMGQYVPFEDENLTVFEELARRTDRPESEVRGQLARYGFSDITVFKQISVLSGGERSRLYLCCLLEEQPDLLYLDEPTNHLDIHSRGILEQALQDFSGAILAVSHDRFFIERIADKVLGFVGSDVSAYYSYAEYRKRARQAEMDSQAEEAARRQDERLEASARNPGRRSDSQNPAELRRLNVKRQQELSRLMDEITGLEEEKNRIESSLGAETEPEVYVRLAALLEELEAAQDNYLELALEMEEAGG